MISKIWLDLGSSKHFFVNIEHFTQSTHCLKQYHSSNVRVGHCIAFCFFKQFSKIYIKKKKQLNLWDVFSEDLFLTLPRWVSSGKWSWVCGRNKRLLQKSGLCWGNGRIRHCVAKGFNWLTETAGQSTPLSDSVGNTDLKEKGRD